MTKRQDGWEFWIDVGGTFTDCVGRAPDKSIHHTKVLSTGAIRGQGTPGVQSDQFIDKAKQGYPPQFFRGYTLQLLPQASYPLAQFRITGFDGETGTFTLEPLLPITLTKKIPISYQISSGEEAPLVGIRKLMGLQLQEPISNITLSLGTTVGTNALLERKGAKVALITTKGFADLLEIGTQARADLFKLDVRKPEKLYHCVYEMHERVDAEGNVLTPLDEAEVIQLLQEVRSQGIGAIAVCLLNAYQNPAHEQYIGRLAKTFAFDHISISVELTRTIKFLDRGDTTVLDAYLSPIIRRYIRKIRSKMMDANFKILTSAGGLVSSDRFSGKDSILSGPAGGVIGYSSIAADSGLSKSIGFDMGGTSTDVSRFNGRYETSYSTEKSGIRIVAPMLEIETIAAGGGSICQFDGQKLTVGPNSAGALPGPACYGHSGPLTLTDINLFNGKLDDSHFPFPLDHEAVQRKILSLVDTIDQVSSLRYSPLELADGFTRIANEKMAAAIKKISSSRGYDVREYILVTFGGAGAQHACAIAELLGIKKILLHPLGGVLSALGIGMANVRRFAEQTTLVRLTDENLVRLEPRFQKMENRLYREVLEEGIKPEEVQPSVRMLDLRYKGEESSITVRYSNESTIKQAFERHHHQLYGYTHGDREVEIVTLRSEVVGHREKPETPIKPLALRNPDPDRISSVYFHGRAHKTGIFIRDNLHPGDTVMGPAIISETYSTIVIDPEWECAVTPKDTIILEHKKDLKRKAYNNGSTRCDPVRLELFTNKFFDVAYQMGAILQRTALSVNVKERLDFSCAILDADGNLVVNAPHIPVHLGAMDEAVKALMRNVQALTPGDVYLSNDPDLGGSHLPDLTVMTPVFDPKTEERLYFVASRAHHAEVGGIHPGSTYPFANNLAEEGIVFRNLKIVENGELLEADLMKHLTSGPFPSRNPRENIADIRAAIAANNRGKMELMRLVEVHSWPVVEAYMEHIKDAAEQKLLVALGQLKSGRYTFEDYMDNGSIIHVDIYVKSKGMTLDFSGSGGVNPNSLNANRAVVQSAVLYCLRCLIGEDIPLNSGVLAPIEIILPEGMLNPPTNPNPELHAPIVAGNVEISQRIVDVIFGALGVCAASQGTMNNVVFGSNNFGYYETICGGIGAGPKFHGADAIHSHMTNTRITDVEVLEKRYPVRIKRFQIRKGSGGRGAYQGGDGVIREFEFLVSLDVSLLTQRRLKAPFGLAGGENGKVGMNILRRGSESKQTVLPPLVQMRVNPGDVLIIKTPGGGGFGHQE